MKRACYLVTVSAALLIVSVVAQTSCKNPRRDAPLLKVAEAPPELEAGHQVFDRYCNPCHPNGATGLGPALNDKPITSLMIETQVRAGVGAMPAFDESVIDDAEMGALLAYMDWLKDVPSEDPPETDEGI